MSISRNVRITRLLLLCIAALVLSYASPEFGLSLCCYGIIVCPQCCGCKYTDCPRCLNGEVACDMQVVMDGITNGSGNCTGINGTYLCETYSLPSTACRWVGTAIIFGTLSPQFELNYNGGAGTKRRVQVEFGPIGNHGWAKFLADGTDGTTCAELTASFVAANAYSASCNMSASSCVLTAVGF